MAVGSIEAPFRIVQRATCTAAAAACTTQYTLAHERTMDLCACVYLRIWKAPFVGTRLLDWRRRQPEQYAKVGGVHTAMLVVVASHRRSPCICACLFHINLCHHLTCIRRHVQAAMYVVNMCALCALSVRDQQQHMHLCCSHKTRGLRRTAFVFRRQHNIIYYFILLHDTPTTLQVVCTFSFTRCCCVALYVVAPGATVPYRSVQMFVCVGSNGFLRGSIRPNA